MHGRRHVGLYMGLYMWSIGSIHAPGGRWIRGLHTLSLTHSLALSLPMRHTRARARTHRLHQSTTGNGADAKVQLNLRRSKSAWLHHGHSKVVDAIYQRLGQVTKVSEWCVGGAWAVRGRVMAIVTSGHVGSARRRALTAQPDSPALS